MGGKIVLSLSFMMLMMLASFQSVFTQVVHTPAPNSKERKEILTVLKAKIDQDGAKDAIIVPYFLKVKGNWAYLSGLPKKNSTVEQYDYNVKTLLKKLDGKWEVVKYLVGSNDFATIDWWKEFKAPKAIFPY
jgi:hypothetical protein